MPARRLLCWLLPALAVPHRGLEPLVVVLDVVSNFGHVELHFRVCRVLLPRICSLYEKIRYPESHKLGEGEIKFTQVYFHLHVPDLRRPCLPRAPW